VFSWITRAAAWAASRIDQTTARWVHDVITGVYGFLRLIFSFVGKAWDYFFLSVKLLLSGLEDVFDKIGLAFEYLWKHYIPSLLKWINTHIITPLLNAVRWIAHEGATMWNYFTHPALFAQFLFGYLIAELERLAWATAKKLGTFFLALIIHNLRTFVMLVEDIFNAVF
jgi:hypothetical protein